MDKSQTNDLRKHMNSAVEKNWVWVSEEKIIGVCTTHQDPCGGLNRLPLHTKWSDDDYDYHREIFFMAHNSQIASDYSQLNLKANPSSKGILEDGQDFKSNRTIAFKICTCPYLLMCVRQERPFRLRRHATCPYYQVHVQQKKSWRRNRATCHIIWCVRSKNFSGSTFGRVGWA